MPRLGESDALAKCLGHESLSNNEEAMFLNLF